MKNNYNFGYVRFYCQNLIILQPDLYNREGWNKNGTKYKRKIEKEVFRNSTPDDQPIAVIVGGQPGCGKGGVISYTQNEAKANGKCIILITTDEYKPYHPNAIEIARKYPTEYVEIF